MPQPSKHAVESAQMGRHVVIRVSPRRSLATNLQVSLGRTRPANSSAPYRVKIPKIWLKREFRVKKPPIAHHPKQGRFGSKTTFSFSLRCPVEIWGFFDLKRRVLGQWEMGVFLTPKPSSSEFGDFVPHRGRADSQSQTLRGPFWILPVD